VEPGCADAVDAGIAAEAATIAPTINPKGS